MLVLTQSTIPVIGYIARLLGFIMNYIYIFLNNFNIASIGFCIILFTIIAYLLMMPLTIRQQKYSKLSSVMNPEVQAIQKKYKNKKDNDSMMQMNQELKVVYEKYGTSPTGGCLPSLIQLPVVFSLYQIIINIPAYVPAVKKIFTDTVSGIYKEETLHEIFTNLASGKGIKIDFSNESEIVKNKIVDVLYKFGSDDWKELISKLPDSLKSIASGAQNEIYNLNNFFGLNLAESPMSTIKSAMSGDKKDILLCIGALMIPILAGVTQFLNTRLMPQQATTSGDENSMAASLKTMNMVMPVMSIVFCFSFASGIGLYWILGSVIRSIQQIFINKYMDKVDIDELIKKNMEKVNKKRAKQGLPPKKVSSAAKANVKSIDYDDKKEEKKNNIEKNIKKSSDYYAENTKAKPGSLKAKAGMVKHYNEKSNKK